MILFWITPISPILASNCHKAQSPETQVRGFFLCCLAVVNYCLTEPATSAVTLNDALQAGKDRLRF